MKNKIRVVVIDDNEQRIDGLQLLINSTDNLACVSSFRDCREIVSHIEKINPDVVLMDIDMPYVNGIEGTLLLKEKFPSLKILIQTVFEDEDKVFAAMCAGADGYILKQTVPEKMIQAIQELMLGGAPMTPVIANKVLKLFYNQNKKTKNQNHFNLTQRELEVLQHLAKGYSYKMIANELNISYPTVNSHITNIYAKLQVESIGGAVYKAMKMGIVH